MPVRTMLQPYSRLSLSRRLHRRRRDVRSRHRSTTCRRRVAKVTYRADLGHWIVTCDDAVPNTVEGPSRRVVNLNTARWSTSGRVRVMGGPSVEAVRVVGSRDARWDPSLVGWFLCVPSLGTSWLRILALEDRSDDTGWEDPDWPYVMWVERGEPDVKQAARLHMIAPGGGVRSEGGRRFVCDHNRMEVVPGDVIEWL